MKNLSLYSLVILLLSSLSAKSESGIREVERIFIKTETQQIEVKVLSQGEKVQAAHKALILRENELTYTNPTISELHERIVKLQKDLINARSALKIQLALDPEHVRLKNEYVKLTRELRQQKSILQNEDN